MKTDFKNVELENIGKIICHFVGSYSLLVANETSEAMELAKTLGEKYHPKKLLFEIDDDIVPTIFIKDFDTKEMLGEPIKASTQFRESTLNIFRQMEGIYIDDDILHALACVYKTHSLVKTIAEHFAIHDTLEYYEINDKLLYKIEVDYYSKFKHKKRIVENKSDTTYWLELSYFYEMVLPTLKHGMKIAIIRNGNCTEYRDVTNAKRIEDGETISKSYVVTES